MQAAAFGRTPKIAQRLLWFCTLVRSRAVVCSDERWNKTDNGLIRSRDERSFCSTIIGQVDSSEGTLLSAIQTRTQLNSNDQIVCSRWVRL